MLKAQIKDILSHEFSDTFRIDKLADDLEKLFIDELADCLVAVLVNLFPEEDNDKSETVS